jgi:hypothetical protein
MLCSASNLSVRDRVNRLRRKNQVAPLCAAESPHEPNHQRNCGLSWPLAEYMPVDTKKRRADFLEAEILRAVSRISRTSRFISCVFMPCLMIVIASPNGDNLCPFEFGAITVLNSQNKVFGKNSRHKIESDQKDFDRLFAHSAWVTF